MNVNLSVPAQPQLLDRAFVNASASNTTAFGPSKLTSTGYGGVTQTRAPKRLPMVLARRGEGGAGADGLLGHADVNATMIYTHVLDRGAGGVVSPLDRLG